MPYKKYPYKTRDVQIFCTKVFSQLLLNTFIEVRLSSNVSTVLSGDGYHTFWTCLPPGGQKKHDKKIKLDSLHARRPPPLLHARRSPSVFTHHTSPLAPFGMLRTLSVHISSHLCLCIAVLPIALQVTSTLHSLTPSSLLSNPTPH